MKKIVLVSVLLVFGFTSIAQFSKKEKKEWKSRYKAYKKDLEGFKFLVEESKSLGKEITKLESQLVDKKREADEKDAQISDLQDENTRMKSEVDIANASAKEAKNAINNNATAASNAESTPAMSMDGVVFKVQIGAFAKKDMSTFFQNNPMFSGEDEGGVQKITLGFFKDYWEADTFKKHLREMGVKNAWVVPYKDGKRVALEDVVDGIL